MGAGGRRFNPGHPDQTSLSCHFPKVCLPLIRIDFDGRRLPNNNTLIVEGFSGACSVTLEAEVVWEYINPDFDTTSFLGEANAVFRAERYMPGEIPHL